MVAPSKWAQPALSTLRPVLDRGVRGLVGADQPLDVVVERVVAQRGVYAESVLSSLEPCRIGRVAGRGVGIAEPARHRFAAAKRQAMVARSARVAERLAAVDMKGVFDLVREGMALDRHREVQVLAVGRHPRVDIGDVRLRIRNRCRRIEMVGGTRRVRHARGEEEGRGQGEESPRHHCHFVASSMNFRIANHRPAKCRCDARISLGHIGIGETMVSMPEPSAQRR